MRSGALLQRPIPRKSQVRMSQTRRNVVPRANVSLTAGGPPPRERPPRRILQNGLGGLDIVPISVSKQDVERALDQTLRERVPSKRKSTKYCFVALNRHYRPKLVTGRAIVT